MINSQSKDIAQKWEFSVSQKFLLMQGFDFQNLCQTKPENLEE